MDLIERNFFSTAARSLPAAALACVIPISFYELIPQNKSTNSTQLCKTTHNEYASSGRRFYRNSWKKPSLA
jgi:hypothetical protein